MAERAQEDVNVRAVALVAAGLVAMVAAVMVVLAFAVSSPPPPPLPREGAPEPRLEADLTFTLEALRATEREQLHSYGWIDREAGVVRIPLDRARALMLGETR